MIVDAKGRQLSSRTVDEDLTLLDERIASLSPDEQALLRCLLDEASHGDDRTMWEMGRVQYERAPVSMAQFLEDPFYLGESCKTLYPQLRRDLTELAATPEVREVVFGGSIGYGKTTAGSILVAWQLYLLSCLASPQESFGLSKGSEIVIVLLSKNLDLAREVLKTAVEDKLKISPYFTEVFPLDVGRDVSEFPKNIRMQIASYQSERVLGTNVFAGMMDEVNFAQGNRRVIRDPKKGVEAFDQAEKVYRTLVRRIKSRFQKAGGDLPGMMIMLSSAMTHNSFTERKMKAARTDPHVFVRSYATWDVKPASDYSGERFHVVIGSSTTRSRLVDGLLPEEEVRALERDGCKVLDVPIEYWEDFHGDLEAAIRDIAGMATHAISQFISRVETVEECTRHDRPHPFSTYEWTTGQPGGFVWDRLCQRVRRRLPGGFEEEGWRPLNAPSAGRWIHIDTALSGDSLGIAMGYIERWVEVVRRDEDGYEYNDVAPYIVIEFMLRVRPPEGDQIFLGDVRALVYQLQEHGFTIVGVTCDSYQSADMLQQLKQRGLNTKIASVDTTMVPYDRLKSCLYENRIEFYGYAPFIEEVKALERDETKGKVDHPIAGSKDVSDAVAGVVHGLVESGGKQPAGLVIETPQRDEEDLSWVSDSKAVPVSPAQDRQGGSNLLGFILD